MSNKRIVITLFLSAAIIYSLSLTTKVTKIKVNETINIEMQNDKNNSNSRSRSANNSLNNTSNGSDSNNKATGSSSGSLTSSANAATAKNSSSTTFKDGTYYGSGKGYKGMVKVKVLVKDGKINSIDIVENVDDPEYFNSAKAVIDSVLDKQSTNVDVISNATFSSNGILDAIDNALSNGGV